MAFKRGIVDWCVQYDVKHKSFANPVYDDGILMT